MYGLPTDVDLSFLVGATLTQVCIGQNEVILNFDNDVSIMIASDVQLTPKEQSGQNLDDASAIGAAILSLLGQAVQSASGTEKGTTTLRWDGGATVEIRDTWPEWESYTISHQGKTIVV